MASTRRCSSAALVAALGCSGTGFLQYRGAAGQAGADGPKLGEARAAAALDDRLADGQGIAGERLEGGDAFLAGYQLHEAVTEEAVESGQRRRIGQLAEDLERAQSHLAPPAKEVEPGEQRHQ